LWGCVIYYLKIICFFNPPDRILELIQPYFQERKILNAAFYNYLS
jgi:hypothetical protein